MVPVANSMGGVWQARRVSVTGYAPTAAIRPTGRGEPGASPSTCAVPDTSPDPDASPDPCASPWLRSLLDGDVWVNQQCQETEGGSTDINPTDTTMGRGSI